MYMHAGKTTVEGAGVEANACWELYTCTADSSGHLLLLHKKL